MKMVPQLVVRSLQGERIVKLEAPLVIGRDPSCEISIDSVRVSRRHAEFVPTPEGVIVRDLGSRNGVILNGTRVNEATLQPADRVMLGDVSVTLRATGSTATLPEFPSKPVPAPAVPPSQEESSLDKTTMLPRGGILAPPGIAGKTSLLPRGQEPPAAESLSRDESRRVEPASRRGLALIGFTPRLFALMFGTTIFVFLATAIPLLMTARMVTNPAARATATNLTLTAALVLALTAGLIAALTVRRLISTRLEGFALDVDLAASGRLDRVDAPQGFPSLARVADSVNHLADRLGQAAAGRDPAPNILAPQMPSGRAPASEHEAVLELDNTFVVQTATGVQSVLGASPSGVVGRHVLEAVTDQALVSAIIDCLGELARTTTASRSVAGTSHTPAYEIEAARPSPDASIIVKLRAVDRYTAP